MAVATVRRPLFWREGRGLAPPPHAPGVTSQRTAVASAAGVPPGRACRGPPRACKSHGTAGDSSAGMASRAGLRQPSSACGRLRAGLRQPGSALLALASAPPAAASRLPTAAPLGHSATPVCLRRRARPACSGCLPPAPRSASPLGRSRPVAAHTLCALRHASLPPIGSTPSAPASAVQAATGSSGARGGGADRGRVPHAGPAPRRHPGRRPTGRTARPHDTRSVPSAGGPHADDGRRPRWRPSPTPPRTTCGGTPRALRARRRPPPCPGASRRPCPAQSSRRRSPRRRPRREGPRP